MADLPNFLSSYTMFYQVNKFLFIVEELFFQFQILSIHKKL